MSFNILISCNWTVLFSRGHHHTLSGNVIGWCWRCYVFCLPVLLKHAWLCAQNREHACVKKNKKTHPCHLPDCNFLSSHKALSLAFLKDILFVLFTLLKMCFYPLLHHHLPQIFRDILKEKNTTFICNMQNKILKLKKHETIQL